MQEGYILGEGKGVLFRDVSSVQGCPYRGVPLYINILAYITHVVHSRIMCIPLITALVSNVPQHQ